MSARSKLRRLQLENARLAEIAQAAENVKNELYDILFQGEDPAEREVRWKWIVLEVKSNKVDLDTIRDRWNKQREALNLEPADASSSDNQPVER